MNLLKKYRGLPVQVRASVWFLICAFLQKGISLITTPIFTRILTTQEYGEYSVFNSWLSIITIVVSLNLSAGVFTQGLIKFDEKKDSFASSIQGLSTALVFLWIVIYLLTSVFWNRILGLTTIQVLSMLIMIWTTSIFSFWADTQRVAYKYKTLVIITLMVSIAKPLLGIILVIKANDKVTARILGLVLVEVLGYSPLLFIQLKKGRKFYSYDSWTYALSFNIPLVPHYLSQVVLNSADRIMINDMIGSSEAGIYSVAYSLSSIMLLFNNALMQTLSPWIYQKIKSERIKEISPVAYLSLMLVAVVNLFLILIAPEAISLFAPVSYRQAIWAIPPIAMSVYFMFCYDLFAKFAFYYEKTKLIMYASMVGAAINVVLNYIFINIFGYVAAGYTTLLCYIIYSVAHYSLMNRICRGKSNGIKPYNTKKILFITAFFVATGFLFLYTYNYPLLRYGLIVCICVISVSKRKGSIEIGKKLFNIKNSC